jgi:hypothetical protein
MIIDGTNGLTFNDASTQTAAGLPLTGGTVTGAVNLATSSGNVGIGTTSPAALGNSLTELTVKATTSDKYANLNLIGVRDVGGNQNGLVNFWNNFSTLTRTAYIGGINTASSNTSGELIFATAASGTLAERMRIDSSGNVLVATTSLRENERLSISRNSTTTAATVINAFNTAATSTTKNTNSIVRFASGASNADVNIHLSDVTTNDYIVGGNNGGLYCMSNTQGVRLASGGTSWSSDSDERLKENLVSISNALSKVNTLRAVTGNYIDDEDKRSRAFLIAQDVQAVLPEAIDATDPKRLGLQYTDVIPLLVSAIKELNTKVDAQATTIESLTTRLTALETP